jgi:hypothetical protein
MRFVCPKLEVWSELYRNINKVWRKVGCIGAPPPVPPSSDAWASLSDDEKEYKWGRMFSWLEQNDAEELAWFSDAEWYVVGAQYIDQPDSSRHSPYKINPFR